MVPVLRDVGQDVTRTAPFRISPEATVMMKAVQSFNQMDTVATGQ